MIDERQHELQWVRYQLDALVEARLARPFNQVDLAAYENLIRLERELLLDA